VAVFSVAEEVGLLGAKAMDLSGLGARAGFVFDTSGPVGDIVVGAPSQTLVEATFHGLAAHAGIAPEKGRSAIQAAARAVSALDLGRLDDDTTVNVGLISGGSATNVVPARCRVSAEVRGHDDGLLSRRVATLIETLEVAATECGVDLEVSARSAFEAFSLSEDQLAVRIATAALRAAGFVPRLTESGGGSDVNVYNAKGLPSVNLSVGMEDVHSPQESMPVARLHEVRRVMRALVEVAGSVTA
jgi:tripeptide aminopeptidase